MACHPALSRGVTQVSIYAERDSPCADDTRRTSGPYRHEGSHAASNRDRLVAPAALVRRQHVGQIPRHVHDGRQVSREVPGRLGGRHQRRRARRARHPDPRRFPLRRGLRRTKLAPLSAAAMDRPRRRLPPVRGDPQPVAPVSARYAPQRDLHRLALAAGDRQDRAPAARLRQNLAPGAEQVHQARPLRHVLLAGHGPLPRHSYRQVQGSQRDRLGHGRRDEQGAPRAARCRLPVHSDRGADFALHGQHLRRRSTRK